MKVVQFLMASIDYYLKYIKQEQENFMKVLERYLHPKQYKNPRILDICCGVANEEPVLIQYFGKSTQFIGIDNGIRIREFIKELGRKSVIIADIRDIEKHISGKFDIVMGRNVPLNPNYNQFEIIEDYWPDVINKTNKYMKKNSLLFLTLAREDEFYRAEKILIENRFRIKVQEKNPIKVQSDYIGICGADIKDNYIIISEPPQ